MIGFLEWLDCVDAEIQERTGDDLADCDMAGLVTESDLRYFHRRGDDPVEAARIVVARRSAAERWARRTARPIGIAAFARG